MIFGRTLPTGSNDASESAVRDWPRLFIGLCLVLASCSSGSSTGVNPVLEPGSATPLELVEIKPRRAENGAVGLEGTFTAHGRTVRFYTRRGPRISLAEVLSGANEFEVDACFVNERGDTILVVAGGHENTMPECRDVVEGRVEGAGADDVDAQNVVITAMDALKNLSFRPEYRGEQNALAGSLAFLRQPPALGGAIVGGE